MLYKEWVDFVVYPSDADKVKNREERINIQNAVSATEKYDKHDIAKKVGYVVSWNDYEMSNDDSFEAMWIDDNGNVIVWTKKRVWSLHRRIDGKEKMTSLPRNPDLTQLF